VTMHWWGSVVVFSTWYAQLPLVHRLWKVTECCT
jgi:hypothetical protein